MDKWIGIASQWGLGGLILLALGTFIYFKVWPALEKFMAQAQEAREKEIDRFEKHLEKKDLLIERIVDKQNQALTNLATTMTGEFKGLRSDVLTALDQKK